jgi:hypothetical protein
MHEGLVGCGALQIGKENGAGEVPSGCGAKIVKLAERAIGK